MFLGLHWSIPRTPYKESHRKGGWYRDEAQYLGITELLSWGDGKDGEAKTSSITYLL